MIGLYFLAVALAWLALSWYLATRLPSGLGIKHPVAQGLFSAVLLAVFLGGPFVDHIVGMRQFDKLCKEQTGLQILPGAVNTKRAKDLPSQKESLEGYVIPINRYREPIADRDTGQEIAWFYHFTTGGGKVGGLAMLGGRYACAAWDLSNPNNKDFLKFKDQVNLTYGDK